MNENKLVFDSKEEMEEYIKNPPRKLTKKEIKELYNNGKSIFEGEL